MSNYLDFNVKSGYSQRVINKQHKVILSAVISDQLLQSAEGWFVNPGNGKGYPRKNWAELGWSLTLVIK